MKFSKKILILMMALAMVFALSVVASAAYEFEVSLGDVEAIDQDATSTKSKQVSVPVYLDGIDPNNEEGIYTFMFSVRYSNGITWSNIKTSADYSDFGKPTCTNGYPSGGKVVAAAQDPVISWQESDTGNLLTTLVFKVPYAVAGDFTVEIYDVKITGDDKVEYDVAGDSTVITVKGSAPAATLTATGKNLVLDGGINAKVQFEYTGTETLYINDVATAAADDGYYYAEIAKSAKDYADVVTFTATAGDLTDSVTTSVAAIIDEYQATAIGTLLALVDAAETYCSYAAIYFAGSTVPTVDATVSATAPSIAGAQDGITFNSTSLVLRDKVALRHYFNVATGTDVAALGLTELDATHAYIEYANIAVADLADVITTEIGGLTINFAPLAYASINEDANVANLVNALYNYYVAAVAYAG